MEDLEPVTNEGDDEIQVVQENKSEVRKRKNVKPECVFDVAHFPEEIECSEKYSDDLYEYRHVLLPKDIYKKIPRNRLLNEMEWRSIGVTQSRGWVHYEIHKPEPFILLFRRPLNTDP